MIVPADPTDPACNEMGVPGILILHKNAVAPEDGRSAMALDDLFIRKVNLGKDAQAPNYPSDRIPGHFHDIFRMGLGLLCWNCYSRHCDLLSTKVFMVAALLLGIGVMFGRVAGSQFAAWMAPGWLIICRTLGNLA